ncbi:MAG: response regulator transcription factor [Kofleriaceae bacterium]
MKVRVDVRESAIVELLERRGHAIVREGWDLALVPTPDAAATLRREFPTAAIIVVTKVGDVEARVRALEVGADDAFDRSFAPSQMMARVDASARRAAMIPPPRDVIQIDGCEIDLSASTATRATTVALTTREVEIVRWLSARPGQVVSRAELLQNVWRVAAGSETRAVDVAIVALRGKLEIDPKDPKIIVSVRGAGYRWG